MGQVAGAIGIEYEDDAAASYMPRFNMHRPISTSSSCGIRAPKSAPRPLGFGQSLGEGQQPRRPMHQLQDQDVRTAANK
jgi:hypothetical protein